jgi:hypothetical protein
VLDSVAQKNWKIRKRGRIGKRQLDGGNVTTTKVNTGLTAIAVSTGLAEGVRGRLRHTNEAVQALLDYGAETALTSHCGTSQLTDEAIDAPLRALAEAAKAAAFQVRYSAHFGLVRRTWQTVACPNDQPATAAPFLETARVAAWRCFTRQLL